MRKILHLLAVLTSLLVLTQAASAQQTITPINGTPLHMTVTPDTILFDEYRGKIVFVEVFGERCPHCIRAIPMYNTLYQKYSDKIGLITIEASGLNEQQLKAFIAQHGITYPTATKKGAGSLLNLAIQRGKSPGWVPFLLILDKSGKVHTAKIGPVPQAELEKIILDLSK